MFLGAPWCFVLCTAGATAAHRTCGHSLADWSDLTIAGGRKMPSCGHDAPLPRPITSRYESQHGRGRLGGDVKTAEAQRMTTTRDRVA